MQFPACYCTTWCGCEIFLNCIYTTMSYPAMLHWTPFNISYFLNIYFCNNCMSKFSFTIFKWKKTGTMFLCIIWHFFVKGKFSLISDIFAWWGKWNIWTYHPGRGYANGVFTFWPHFTNNDWNCHNPTNNPKQHKTRLIYYYVAANWHFRLVFWIVPIYFWSSFHFQKLRLPSIFKKI